MKKSNWYDTPLSPPRTLGDTGGPRPFAKVASMATHVKAEIRESWNKPLAFINDIITPNPQKKENSSPDDEIVARGIIAEEDQLNLDEM
jgi:hypothetical protein